MTLDSSDPSLRAGRGTLAGGVRAQFETEFESRAQLRALIHGQHPLFWRKVSYKTLVSPVSLVAWRITAAATRIKWRKIVGWNRVRVHFRLLQSWLRPHALTIDPSLHPLTAPKKREHRSLLEGYDPRERKPKTLLFNVSQL
jgi:hypothetical protein